MEFFDSVQLSTDNSQRTTDFFHNFKKNKSSLHLSSSQTSSSVTEPVEGTTSGTSTSSATAYPTTVDRSPLTVDIDFLYAKAHYYHAVGLTERDDIVGACEHYLIALEIMESLVETSSLWHLMAKDKRLKSKGEEKAHGSKLDAHSSKKSVDRCPLTVDHPEDYEKIRFLAMINMRLGELLYNNHHFDMAITTFLESLKHVRKINDHEFESIILKYIGNTYYVSDNIDSALNYYYESLKTSDNQGNHIDIQKCLALILYEKGDKDSAYYILKDNIRRTEDQSVHDAYCYTLGEMFYHDKVYDSAIHYLKGSFESETSNIKFASAKILYSLYDSINDISNRNHYGDIYINFSNDEINSCIKRDSVQKIYNEYLTRKHKNHEARLRRIYIYTFLPVLITVIIISLYLFFIKKENKEKDSVIKDLRFKYSIIKGKIKNKNKELREKDEIIKSKDLELTETKDKIQYMKIVTDINTFYESDICKRILSQNINRVIRLDNNDLTTLLKTADYHLNNLSAKIKKEFPNLKKDDLYYLCFVLLKLNNHEISLLLGKNRKTIWERMKNIRERMNLNDDENIYDVLLRFLRQ